MEDEYYTAFEFTGALSDSIAAANTTLTGHSLGGGLAGYVASVSGTKATLFDHMPFGIAAANRADVLGANDNHLSQTRLPQTSVRERRAA